MKNFSFCLAFFAVTIVSAQTVKYKLPDGQIFPQHVFEVLKKNSEKNDLEFKVVDSIVSENSIIRIVEVKNKGYFEAQEKNEKFDPFGKFKERIGSEFPINKFFNEKGQTFDTTFLEGKPTVINFWFTRCAPCIIELPHLQALEKKFGKRVNFLAITFNSKSEVDNFLKKKNFDYLHITDSQKQIKEIGISGYPMTFILNKSGKISNVYGGLNDFEVDEINHHLMNMLQ